MILPIPTGYLAIYYTSPCIGIFPDARWLHVFTDLLNTLRACSHVKSKPETPCLSGHCLDFSLFFLFRILSHFYVVLMFLMRLGFALPLLTNLSPRSRSWCYPTTCPSALFFFSREPPSSSFSCLYILFFSSPYMPIPLGPTFLHFIGYVSHLYCPSHVFIPNFVHLNILCVYISNHLGSQLCELCHLFYVLISETSWISCLTVVWHCFGFVFNDMMSNS